MAIENKNRLTNQPVSFSSELTPVIENLNRLELAHSAPERLQPLLDHMVSKIGGTLQKMKDEGSEFKVCGPDWCRENPELAGESHANVIVETYGATYALPNKDPKANVEALAAGDLDMYLIFENGKPVGTACMVIQSNGWAELGRAASLGSVGNQLIQDLRILRWLTEEKQTEKTFGIFSTCRTAPDRNVGSETQPEMMRGGQAVTHMWSQFPEVKVGGFGPLYKKHGSLEQFAYTFVTNREVFASTEPYISETVNRQFVQDWVSNYQVAKKDNKNAEKLNVARFSVHYPPLETKLTHLIHGEITLASGSESFEGLDKAIARLDEVQVPFIQVQVPIDVDSRKVQEELRDREFQAFLFTPGVEGKQPPLLWFGKVTKGVSVIPTFWQGTDVGNPFWNWNLSHFASQVAKKW